MCVKNILSLLLTLGNLVIMLIGVAVLTVGAVIQWGGPAVYRIVSPALEQLIKGTTFVGQQNISTSIEEVSTLMNQYSPFIRSGGLILFVLGVFLFALGIVGCVGACCTLKILLFVYAVCIGLIFLVFLTVTIALFVSRPKLEQWGAVGLKEVLTNSYKGLTIKDDPQTGGLTVDAAQDAVSRLIDVLQIKFSCCGVDDYKEFHSAKLWTRTVNYKGKPINLETPFSCCVVQGKVALEPSNPEKCASIPLDPTLNNFQQPCYPKLWSAVDKSIQLVGYILIGITGGLFVIVLLTAILIRMAAKDDFTCL